MEVVGTVQRQGGGHCPRRAPCFTRREKDAVHGARGVLISGADVVEVGEAAAVGPDHEQRGGGAHGPDPGVEQVRPEYQRILAHPPGGCGPLLQHDVVPAAFTDRGERLRRAVVVIDEGEPRSDDRCDAQCVPGRRGDGAQSGGQVVHSGEAVADEEHAMGGQHRGRERVRCRAGAGEKERRRDPDAPHFVIHARPVASSTSRASPNTMRYQANTSKVRWETKRTSHFTTTNALANAMTKPSAKTAASDPDRRSRFSHSSSPVAANITGMASRKENSAAAGRATPTSNAPMIVAPERDTPGMSEHSCAIPIHSAVAYPICITDSKRGEGRQRPLARMATPPAINAAITTAGVNRCAVIQ